MTTDQQNTGAKLKKAGAAVGLTGISFALIWNVYSALDTRVRKVETVSAMQTVSIKSVDKKLDKVDNKLDKIDNSILNLSVQLGRLNPE